MDLTAPVLIAMAVVIAAIEMTWVYRLVNKVGPARTKAIVRELAPELAGAVWAARPNINPMDPQGMVARREELKVQRAITAAKTRSEILAWLAGKWGGTQAATTLVWLEKLGIVNQQVLETAGDWMPLVSPVAHKLQEHANAKLKAEDGTTSPFDPSRGF